MSHILEKAEVTLEFFQELFSGQYETSEIEDGILFFITEYGTAIMIELNEDDGLIQWFCADKVKDDSDELTLARLCKQYNETDELQCCFVSYDIDEVYKIYMGCSYEMRYDKGIILEQLVTTHLSFQDSMLYFFSELQRLGYFPERTEI